MKKFILILSLILFSELFSDGARYLIITPDIYYDAVFPLAQWKHKKGVMSKIVKLSDIGSDSAEIKDYIRDAYTNWIPRPEYVLLVGDQYTLPYGIYFPSWNLYYPNRGTWTDQYYVNLTESNDYKDDILIGRLPCANAVQCSVMVNKILSYEKGFLKNSDWYIKATGIARDSETPVYDSCYKTAIRKIRILLLNNGFSSVDTLFRSNGANSISVQDSVSLGRGFVIYRGSTHSSTDNWNHPFGVNPLVINNDSMSAVVISPTCRTMFFPETLPTYPEPTTAAGNRWLRQGTISIPKGAVAFWGTTTHYYGPPNSFPDQQTFWRNAAGIRFFQAITNESEHILGKALRKAKDSAFVCCSISTLGQNGSATACSVAYMEWNLLGDPELNLWTAIPKPMLVTHETIINTDSQNFSVEVKDSITEQPLSNALVCIMFDTLIYQYDNTNNSGQVSFSIHPQYPGLMSLTVTAPNYIPYTKDVKVRIEQDVGCTKIIVPIGTIDIGTVITPICSVYNYGTTTESYRVRMKIGTFYNDTAYMDNHIASTYHHITFPDWIALQSGLHLVSCSTELSYDMNRFNDRRTGAVACSITVHTITATAGANGSIVPEGDVMVEYGYDTTFKIIPDPGYHITCLIVDGDTISPETSYTFENVTQNHTIYAEFTIITHSLNVTIIGNGAVIKNPDLLEYAYGTNVELLANPDNGSIFVEWQGDTVSNQNPITLTIDNNKNITAYFVTSGWEPMKNLTIIPVSKGVKDGGALMSNGNIIYALLGGNSNKFFAYYIENDSWALKCSMPYAQRPDGRFVRKKVKAGGALVSNGCTLYAFKGGNTNEFWAYISQQDTWIQKSPIPELANGSIIKRKVKAGGSLVAYACSIYAFKGGNTNEFWLYNSSNDSWYQRKSLITSESKKVKSGGALVAVSDTIYAFVGGNTNCFYAYIPGQDSWIKKADAIFGSLKTLRRRINNGAAMVEKDGIIYALKGGNTQDFGYYNSEQDTWYSLDSMPLGTENKRVKTGGALTVKDYSIYALKGGNTKEFWRYTPSSEMSNVKSQMSKLLIQVIGNWKLGIGNFITVTPNPFTNFATVRYTVPFSSKVVIKLYNTNGRLVESLVDEYLNSGNYTIKLCVKNFAKGIYFLFYRCDLKKGLRPDSGKTSNLKIIVN